MPVMVSGRSGVTNTAGLFLSLQSGLTMMQFRALVLILLLSPALLECKKEELNGASKSVSFREFHILR